MYRVTEERFHELIEEAVALIPQEFKSRMDNIIFIAEDYPSDSDLKRLNLSNKYSLLGLYSGVPYTQRNTGYSGVTPDRVILFQKNIETLCRNESELKAKIYEVLIHEVAHYFGMDEDEIAEAGF